MEKWEGKQKTEVEIEKIEGDKRRRKVEKVRLKRRERVEGDIEGGGLRKQRESGGKKLKFNV